MAEANLDAVIERLDRLEAALLKLVEIVEARGATLAPAATVPLAPVLSHEPPRIQVAPVHAPRPVMPSHVAAPAPADVVAYHTPLAEHEIMVPPPEASIEEVIARLFEAALEPDPEMTWATLTQLFHSSQLVGPRAIDHFKGFAWQRLRRNARSYLIDGNPRTFQIAYTDPRETTGNEKEVRIFLKAGDNRMPVPLGLQRDAARDNAWRVTMTSL